MAGRIASGLLLGSMVLWVTPLQSIHSTVAPLDVETPQVLDDRLEIGLFAAAPQIVHPIAVDVDAQGRLLVVESHTHFRPPQYHGPRFDRIRRLHDTDGDGRADTITTFYEGTVATMDLAVHPDGSVYLATRNDILRLRDRDGDGRADQVERLLSLDTPGNYPHNGLCGLCFDGRNGLFFGMGENLGEPYRLKGADGVVLTGGGEGGNVFHCTIEGRNLRRVATGFWNPFGIGRDIYDHVIVADNDPDASPPCRLVYLVEGGDYGFQFRYGRSGRHPFQAWNGELPGTLPYICGTGESPCEALCYESDGLPEDYRGRWLVPAWADHRLECYTLQSQGASFKAERSVVVQGGNDFYPAGIAIAADGSLFVSDWGSRSYELHGRGAIWLIRRRKPTKPERPMRADLALYSADRRTREIAARELARTDQGRQVLRQGLKADDVRVRTTALSALDQADEPPDSLVPLLRDPDPGLRELALRCLLRRDPLPQGAGPEWLKDQPSALVALAVADPRFPLPLDICRPLLTSADPFVRHAAVLRLARDAAWRRQLHQQRLDRADERLALLLAERMSSDPSRLQHLRAFLQDPEPQVRFLAVKWVSDENLREYRRDVAALLQRSDLAPPHFLAANTALARLDGKPVHEHALAGYFLQQLEQPSTSPALRLAALRAVPAHYGPLATSRLLQWLAEGDDLWKIELLRLLKDRGDRSARETVQKLASDRRYSPSVRCQAILTLSALTDDAGCFIPFVRDTDAQVAAEALRALSGAKLSASQQQQLREAAAQRSELRPLLWRVLGLAPAAGQRPTTHDTQAWLRFLQGPSQRDAGRRVFESPRLVGCYRCHRVEGRGSDIGPDLSLIGRTDRSWILESLLQPSAVVAPHYQTWRITTSDERTRIGLLAGTHYDEAEYVDEHGQRFRVRNSEVIELRAVPQSLMPDKLLDQLTDQEIRDLLAYLTSLR